MTFTIITFFLLLLLMPGIIFRRAYFLFPFFRKYAKQTLTNDIIGIILTSIVIHLIFLYATSIFTNYITNLRGDLISILDKYENGENIDIAALKNFKLSPIILYNIVIWGVSGYLGLVINRFIRFFKIDTSTRIFRFGNEWYYYFKGKVLDFREFDDNSENISLIYLDVLVETTDGTYIYMGICKYYTLAENGGLSHICLEGAKRRKMCDDKKGKEAHFPIPSSIVIIPGDQIRNLNFRYFKDVEKQKKRGHSIRETLLLIVDTFIIMELLFIFKRRFLNDKTD